MSKEVYEETGLVVSSSMLLMDGVGLLDECRRSVNYHIWSLYACESVGEAQMNYEADKIGWYTEKEIQALPLVPNQSFS